MMTKNKLFSTLLVLLALMPVPAFSAATDDSHIEWWRDARFGMFIHWGLYSLSTHGNEWIYWHDRIPYETYRQRMERFNPTRFDAQEWADAMQSYAAAIVPASTTVAAAAATLSSRCGAPSVSSTAVFSRWNLKRSTTSSSTPAASPRQPAWAAATQVPALSVSNSGRQSAVMTTQG